MKLHSNFFQKYSELKAEESWLAIISLGEERLESTLNPPLDNKQKTDIHLILATTYHYIGNYDKTITHARFAVDMAQMLDQQVRGYYLVSAAYRSKAQTLPLEVSYKDEALEAINKALNLTSFSEISELCKAKVYFNAGALYHDVFTDLPKAVEFYQHSMSALDKDGDDYNRVALRYIRVLLESGQVNHAAAEARKLHEFVNEVSKTGVHLLQLEAKIAIAQQRYTKADWLLEKAVDNAIKKEMQGDILRLKQLKKGISENVLIDRLNSLNLATSVISAQVREIAESFHAIVTTKPLLDSETREKIGESWAGRMTSHTHFNRWEL